MYIYTHTHFFNIYKYKSNSQNPSYKQALMMDSVSIMEIRSEWSLLLANDKVWHRMYFIFLQYDNLQFLSTVLALAFRKNRNNSWLKIVIGLIS